MFLHVPAANAQDARHGPRQAGLTGYLPIPDGGDVADLGLLQKAAVERIGQMARKRAYRGPDPAVPVGEGGQRIMTRRLKVPKHAPATNRIEANGPSGAVLLWVARRRLGLHSGF